MKLSDLEPVFYNHKGNRRRTTGVVGALMFVAVLQAGCTVAAGAQYDDGKAQKSVENEGFTNINHEDTTYFPLTLRECAEADHVKHEFTATDPSGNKVKVKVCKGLFNGATIEDRKP